MAQPTFAYSVIATFDDPSLIESWCDWLRREHFAEVCAAGASDACLVERRVVAGEPPCFEARYRFADPFAFDVYEREHAPRLRDEGLRRFPKGIRYRRTSGEIRWRYPI